MRRLLAALGAVFLLFCWLPAPAETEPVYYLTSLDGIRQANRAPGYYPANGVVPVVLLPGNGTNLFTPGWDWETPLAEIRASIDGPYAVALWCDNVQRDEQPGGSTLCPWDDDAGWAVVYANLAALRLACVNRGAFGVFWDGEIYTSTPGNNGGWMPASAWTNGARARERGQGVNAALGGLMVGQYVLVDNVNGRDGWKQFWKGTYDENGIDLLLDEGHFLVGSTTKALEGYGVTNCPGRTIRSGEFKGSVPDKSFWIYPWDGDAATDLALYSHKWL